MNIGFSDENIEYRFTEKFVFLFFFIFIIFVILFLVSIMQYLLAWYICFCMHQRSVIQRDHCPAEVKREIQIICLYPQNAKEI